MIAKFYKTYKLCRGVGFGFYGRVGKWWRLAIKRKFLQLAKIF